MSLLLVVSIASAQHIITPMLAPTGPPGAPGPVTGANSVLQGTTSTYTVTSATGTINYVWSLSNNSAGTITATSTSATIHWSSSFSGVIYIVCAAENSLGSTNGPTLTVQVTQPVTPLISGVISPTLQNNTTPATITSTPASGGNGIYSYQWQSSLNNSTWTPISTGLTSSYTPQNQAQSTYYRLITTSVSGSVTSNTAFVNTMVSNSYSPNDDIVSVNELTGTANVVIPLYTIQAAHVTFPINLVYSATGIKGTDVEQNAGMGWNISLGGAVTRQLRGLPDDVSKDSNGNSALGWFYANNGSAISLLGFGNDNNTSTCIDENSDIGMLASTFPGNTDTEPDIFQVNAPGLSCQLVFDKNKMIQVIPYQDLKVTYTTSAQGSADQGQIVSFTITNDKGITYSFSATSTVTQKATTTQGSVNYFQSNYNNYKNGITYYSSWGLISIADVHNNDINISYTPAPVSNFSNPVQLSVGGAAFTTLYTMAGSVTSQLPSSIVCMNTLGGEGQAFQITYVHTPNSNKSCISSITGMGHNILLGYNNVTTGGGSYIRLFLNSIIDQTCSTQIVNGQAMALASYAPLNLTFNYSHTGSTFNSTSSLASPSQSNLDYWGYTNTASSNTSLLPSVDINPSTVGYERYRNRQYLASPTAIYTYAISGANREADQNSTLGTLSQINYSAGGYTALSYEPNEYYDNTIQEIVPGGGIRVTQILDHDGVGTDNDFIKTYTYGNQSTGISTGKPTSLPVFAFTTPYSGSNTGSALWTSSTMVSLVDLSTEDHSILYSTITEKINNGGSTVYQYALPATNWDTTVPTNPTWSPTGLPTWNQTLVDVGRLQGSGGSCQIEGVLRNDVNTYPFPPNTNYDFERGLLTNVLKYNSSGTQVSETDYYYQTPEAPIDIAALKYDVNSYATNYAKYTIHTSAAPLVSQVVNKVFDLTNVSPGAQPTGAQVVTTNNVYNTGQHKLSQQAVTNSDGSINTVNIKYSKDYQITAAGDAYLSNLLALQNDNLNIPVETYTQFTPVNSTQALTTGADLILFGTFPNQGVNGLAGGIIDKTVIESPGPAPVQHQEFSSPNGIANFSPSSISSSNTFQYDSRYIVTENDLAYDYTGLLLSKDDGFKHVKTTIYDNFNSFRLRAVFNNVSFDQIGMDYPLFFVAHRTINYANSPNAYNFFVPASSPVQNLTNSGVTRNGETAMMIPATEILMKTVNKNPAANNHIFSLWVNSAVSGTITVTATDGTNTVSAQLGFDATVGNSKYPTGFEYCRVNIPVATLTASSILRISFSSNQDISCTDILTYPDIADVTMYSYDSNNNKIAETNGNGISTYYSYDGLGRLLYVYDQDNNIIERKTYVNNNPAINSTPSLNLSWTKSADIANPQTFQTEEPINFATVITSGNGCTLNGGSLYSWDFGDGTTESAIYDTAPTHPYVVKNGNTGPQTYTCTLTITSPDSSIPFSISTVVTL